MRTGGREGHTLLRSGSGIKGKTSRKEAKKCSVYSFCVCNCDIVTAIHDRDELGLRDKILDL